MHSGLPGNAHSISPQITTFVFLNNGNKSAKALPFQPTLIMLAVERARERLPIPMVEAVGDIKEDAACSHIADNILTHGRIQHQLPSSTST
jgi:hypothetical protein